MHGVPKWGVLTPCNSIYEFADVFWLLYSLQPVDVASIQEKDSDDPSRVGAAANALYADGGLSTSIGKVQGDGGASYSLNRLQNRQNLTDRVLQNAVRQIGIACERLSVVDGVKHRASEVFKKVGWLVHVYV